jgi:hypothetical protein
MLVTVVPSTAKNYYFDTRVKINKDTTKYYDTVADITTAIEITKYYDTSLNIKTDINIIKHFDTSICVKSDVTKYFDTSIKTNTDTIHYCDTAIKANAEVKYYYDTSINTPHDTTIHTDTTQINPFNPAPQEEKSGIVSVSINLQELTLSDSFSMDTTDDIQILDYVSGQILDFSYLYRVGETSQQDSILTAKGMYDCDEILYKSINYSYGNKTHTLREHAEKIADALNKRLVYHADNFQHSQTWIGDGQTYESIISSLFGWSSSIPHKAINVFMRAKDNSLNIIQRGMEQTTIDITDTAHTRPIINKSLERTMINYSNSSGAGHDYSRGLYVEPLPFWGTLVFGDAVCSYQSGYLRDETINGDTSYYDYEGDGFGTGKYLSRKTTNHADGSKTVIEYDYEKTKSGVKVLGTETETHTEADGTETVRKTIHAPLGGGFYGTSVYIDGEYQGSSIGTGSPAATASRYLCNQESITLGGANYDGGGNNPLGHGNVLKESANVPSNDKNVMNDYLNDLKWLNRKIKEVVSMDIYNYDHVIDFSERINFKGNEYYLVSNNISQTTKELKQSITLVRWY